MSSAKKTAKERKRLRNAKNDQSESSTENEDSCETGVFKLILLSPNKIKIYQLFLSSSKQKLIV